MPQQDPISLNVKGVSDLVKSGLNKVPGGATDASEGVASTKVDVLDLSMSDEELLKLASHTEAEYSGYEKDIETRTKANKTYYKGTQYKGSQYATDFPIAGNHIFEAEETFLPAALAKNPEPVVWSDNSTEGAAQASDVKTMLQYHADTLVLRRKLNRMTRQWTIYLLGVLKHGWDSEINDIKTETRDPRNFIFSKDGFVDEYGDFRGSLLGERNTCTAARLAELFPKQEAFITVMVSGLMGTMVTYTDWWNDKYTFTTFKEKVLDKTRNPYFNYDREEDDEDVDGNPITVKTPGSNHFAKPKMPYTFLSVFSLGEQPHDETGLIEQNIPNQNRITKRENQIDANFDRSNNSIGLSGQNFNEETAKQAATAMQKGNPVLIPAGGPVNEAIARFPAPDVPAGMFNQLDRDINGLRTIFGTQGITASQPDEDQTARGMILNQQYDNTRIGGGIGDALEQVADNTFNWWTQMYYVFYDDDHYAAILGQMKAVEYVQFKNADLKRRMVVSVAPNSMKPKDEVSQANEALSLYDKGAIDPKTLLTILDFPDAQKTAEQAVLWKLNPMLYMQLNFPELAQQMQAAATGAVPPPGGGAPEVGGTPAPSLAAPPANPSLSQVPL